jgi:hypothetical protein
MLDFAEALKSDPGNAAASDFLEKKTSKVSINEHYTTFLANFLLAINIVFEDTNPWRCTQTTQGAHHYRQYYQLNPIFINLTNLTDNFEDSTQPHSPGPSTIDNRDGHASAYILAVSEAPASYIAIAITFH